MKFPIKTIAAAVAVFAAVAGFASPYAAAHGPDGKASLMFKTYEKGDIPDRFKGKKNPLAKSDEDVQAGMALYQRNCVMCHGANADGEGHMRAVMEEKPANLKTMLKHYPDADDYYMRIISVGGSGFGIPMPGYERMLDENQIWQLISWMQAGFPGAGTEVQDGPMGPGGHMGQGGHMMPGGHMGPGGHMMPGGQMGPGMPPGPGMPKTQ